MAATLRREGKNSEAEQMLRRAEDAQIIQEGEARGKEIIERITGTKQ